MAKKKDYRAEARELKKLGLVNYDLRKPLSRGQKSQITKLRQEYGHFLKHPEQFHASSVGKATAKLLKASGFKVTPKGRAIIPLDGYKTASIAKGGKIVMSTPGRMKETIHLSGHKDYFAKLQRLSEKKLPRNVMVTVRIGDHAPFARARFTSMHELQKYVNESFQPKDPGSDRRKLLAQMSVVEIPRNAPTNEARRNAKKKAASKKSRRP